MFKRFYVVPSGINLTFNYMFERFSGSRATINMFYYYYLFSGHSHYKHILLLLLLYYYILLLLFTQKDSIIKQIWTKRPKGNV